MVLRSRFSNMCISLRIPWDIQGFTVGSRAAFEEMNRAIRARKVRPVVDRTFPFSEAKHALASLEKGGRFGKIVIRVS
jgi:NADPH:quinone reductase-like Zn-dependent oxidoreductase